MAELFSIKKAVDLGGMVWFKAFKTGCVIGIIIFLGYCIYATAIKPHFNPLKTQTQRAEEIINNEYSIGWNFGCARFPVGRTKEPINPKGGGIK